MTYIAAFRCLGGIVMCADTLETRGEYKNYTEKIEIVDDQSFPLAVAGAGMADVIEPISNEIVTRVQSEKPKTQSDLFAVVRRAIGDVYRDELPALVLGSLCAGG